PKCLEGFRPPRPHFALGVLNRSHEPFPGLIHMNMMSKLGLNRNRSASRARAWARYSALACDFISALGGTQTPNLLIRRSGHIVQDRPSPVVGWADIPQLSARDASCPAAWQQCWQ